MSDLQPLTSGMRSGAVAPRLRPACTDGHNKAATAFRSGAFHCRLSMLDSQKRFVSIWLPRCAGCIAADGCAHATGPAPWWSAARATKVVAAAAAKRRDDESQHRTPDSCRLLAAASKTSLAEGHRTGQSRHATGAAFARRVVLYETSVNSAESELPRGPANLRTSAVARLRRQTAKFGRKAVARQQGWPRIHAVSSLRRHLTAASAVCGFGRKDGQ